MLLTAGTCHMMAAQINCNYLVHAFRPRYPLSQHPFLHSQLPLGKCQFQKCCGQLKMALAVLVGVSLCVCVCIGGGCVRVCRWGCTCRCVYVCVPAHVYAFCHLIICIFSALTCIFIVFSVLFSTGETRWNFVQIWINITKIKLANLNKFIVQFSLCQFRFISIYI